MKVNDVIDLNDLLPALERYRLLYWEARAHELEGYLLNAKHQQSEMTDDEIDDEWDAFHGRRSIRNPNPTGKDWMEQRYELLCAEQDIMRIMRGESPDEVTKLQDRVLHECGE